MSDGPLFPLSVCFPVSWFLGLQMCLGLFYTIEMCFSVCRCVYVQFVVLFIQVTSANSIGIFQCIFSTLPGNNIVVSCFSWQLCIVIHCYIAVLVDSHFRRKDKIFKCVRKLIIAQPAAANRQLQAFNSIDRYVLLTNCNIKTPGFILLSCGLKTVSAL